MKKLLGILIGIGLNFGSFAQSGRLLDSLELESAQIFTSLKEAATISPDSVYRLHLKGKKLRDIPEAVFKFPNLQELVLTRNQFTEIPSSIVKLEKLQKLSFAKNHIKYINPMLAQLKNLRELVVSQNDLVELPKELVDLQNLVVLDVWSNELEAVPSEFKNFKKLKRVDLRVIILTDSQKEDIQKHFPTGTEVLFSPGCNCGN